MNDNLKASVDGKMFLSSFSDEEWLWALTEGRESSELLKACLPALPEEQVQRRFVGKAYHDAFQQAIEAFNRFLAGARSLGLVLTPHSTLLDFGCGWGRLSQVAFRHFAAQNIYSVDVQEDALEICRSTGLGTNLIQVPMKPPAGIASSSIDLIIAYSVFSHLSEAAHEAWLEDFFRILRPGGVIAITTRPRAFIQYVESLRGRPDLPAHARGLEKLIWNHSDPSAAYDKGGFVYGKYRDHGVMGEDYGEALISAEYARLRWSRLYDGITFVKADAKVDQAIILARKPPA